MKALCIREFIPSFDYKTLISKHDIKYLLVVDKSATEYMPMFRKLVNSNVIVLDREESLENILKSKKVDAPIVWITESDTISRSFVDIYMHNILKTNNMDIIGGAHKILEREYDLLSIPLFSEQ